MGWKEKGAQHPSDDNDEEKNEREEGRDKKSKSTRGYLDHTCRMVYWSQLDVLFSFQRVRIFTTLL